MHDVSKKESSGWTRTCLAAGLSAALAACGGDGGGSSGPPIQLTVTASQATIVAGQSTQVTAQEVNDTTGAGVAWSLSCPQAVCGTLSSSLTAATYTAPGTAPPTDLTVTITARAQADAAVTATIDITVASSPISISVGGDGTVAARSSTPVTATLVADPTKAGVKWSVSCPTAPCGSVSASTTPSGVPATYSAPPAAPAADLPVTLTATAAANAAISASTMLTVPAIAVTVSSNAAGDVAAETTVQLTASVSYDPDERGVSWTLHCGAADCGRIAPASSASGTPVTYTAPSTPPPTNLPVTVTAQSMSAASAQGSAEVTVAAVAVSIAPVSALVPLGITQQFTGNVAFDPTVSGVAWQLLQSGAPCSNACGRVAPLSTANGGTITYTAPASLPANSTVTLAATSAPDNLGSTTAQVMLTTGSVALAPLDMAIPNHGSQQATLTNTGHANLSISSIAVSGAGAARFTESNNCPHGLASGASCTISVSFLSLKKPFQAAAVLTIIDSSSDSPQKVNLTGGSSQSASTAATVHAALTRTGGRVTPRPTGNAPVGTREIRLVDTAREDPYSADGSSRELMVRLWYPMATDGAVCSRADYTAPQTWAYFGTLVDVTLPEVLTHSCRNASIATGTHPVVFVSHGFTGVATDYTYLAEDLASHGYVVIAINHTHEATAVTFPDGRLEKSVLGSHLTDSSHTDPATLDSAVEVRLADLKFVLDELPRLNSGRDSDFAGRLDLSNIALVGHSLGGLTTVRALEKEPRFKAGVLLDAVVPPQRVATLRQPVLDVMVGRQRWDETDCRLWDSLRGGRVAVSFPHAEHIALSDAVWLLEGSVKTGTTPAAIIAATRGYVAAFLDANIRSSASYSLLSASAATTGGVVAQGSQPLCTQP